jgi:hypothetical protein
MHYRYSRLFTRIGLGQWSTPQGSSSPEEEIDAHMKAWSEAGWRLHTVTSVSRDGPHAQELTHSFFWSKES